MKRRLLNFLYNLDRAVASLCGAPPQETISSEVGRHHFTNPAASLIYRVLDKIQRNHCENAIVHANKLDQVDDGKEQ
jgi:hypothetical protein